MKLTREQLMQMINDCDEVVVDDSDCTFTMQRVETADGFGLDLGEYPQLSDNSEILRIEDDEKNEEIHFVLGDLLTAEFDAESGRLPAIDIAGTPQVITLYELRAMAPEDLLFGPEADKQRLAQMSTNCDWLIGQFDKLHRVLKLPPATWQSRVQAVLQEVTRMVVSREELGEFVTSQPPTGSPCDPEIQAMIDEDSHGEHPDWPRVDWEHEVGEGDVQSSYWDWVQSQVEQKKDIGA